MKVRGHQSRFESGFRLLMFNLSYFESNEVRFEMRLKQNISFLFKFNLF